MRLRRWIVLVAVGLWMLLTGCLMRINDGGDSTSFSAAKKAAVEQDVRRFASTVARDVTQKGPAAWQKHFADGPSFFMASEGRLQFPNRQSAAHGDRKSTRLNSSHDQISYAVFFLKNKIHSSFLLQTSLDRNIV